MYMKPRAKPYVVWLGDTIFNYISSKEVLNKVVP